MDEEEEKVKEKEEQVKKDESRRVPRAPEADR